MFVINHTTNSVKRKYTIEDLENILDSIPNCIGLKDENGKYIYVNKAFCENINLPKDDIIEKTDIDFKNIKNTTIFDKDDEKVLKTNLPILSEKKVNICNKKRWFETYKTPINKGQYSKPWIMSISRDTTLDKTLDEDLQSLFSIEESYELNKNVMLPQFNTKDIINNKFIYNKYIYKFKRIIDNISTRLKANGISLFLYNKFDKSLDLYLNIGSSNITVQDNVKLSNEHILNLSKNIYNDILEIDKNHIFSKYKKDHTKSCIRTCSITYSNELIGVINIYYPYGYVPKFLQDDFIKSTCNKLGVLIKNQLLSNQLKYEFQKRIYIEKELELFLETATDLYALVDCDNNFIKISNNFVNNLGWSKNELLKLKFKDLIHPDDVEEYNNFKMDMCNLKNFKGSGLTHRYRCKNGDYKILKWNWNFVQDKKYIMLTGTDVTEEKKLLEEKKRLEETVELETLKTTFFANVSHEFKTPLNIILTAIQLISVNFSNYPDCNCNQTIAKYIKSIKQNSYRLLKLVNNLLDLTKLDGGYYELKPIKCNIVNLIEEIVLSVADHIGNKKRTIIFDTSQEEILTSCDPDKIETILLNLLSNAVKFTNENDYIEVNINIDDNFKNIMVSVKNSGSKINESDAEIIFNRFTQVDNLLNRPCEGTGIGLALAKSFVDLHEGSIWVNTQVDVGAEIIFTIPIKNFERKDVSEFHAKTLNANIEKYNVEFSDIYNL